MNRLFYGDNLEVLRRDIKDESVDLVYIDPPFNSKRNYNMIYTNVGKEDKAQAQAFVDTWTWDDLANEGLNAIKANYNRVFTRQSIDLIIGLEKVLGRGTLLAYLVSITLRIAEIHRVLKPTGSFYLHCDPTASHYLKLVLDAVFCPSGGEIRNEIIWGYSRMAAKGQKQLSRCHDVIFWYSKSNKWIFNVDDIRLPYSEKSKARAGYKKTNLGGGKPKSEICELNEIGKFPEDWIQIPFIRGNEYLGYATQKPEALLERFIKASSNEGDVIMDCYCGCGTSVAVAQRLGRQWIGVDITYQSISLIFRRLAFNFGLEILDGIVLGGIPMDFESAVELAHKKDDRVRKEFEKWMVLTYSRNMALVNDKKGGDGGIDGVAYILDRNEEGVDEDKQVIFSVKSSEKLTPAVVRELNGTVEREGAVRGILLTLYRFENLVKESKQYGNYENKFLNTHFRKIEVICVQDILEGACLNMATSLEVLKKAEFKQKGRQGELGLGE